MKALLYCNKQAPYVGLEPTNHYMGWENKKEEISLEFYDFIANGTVCAMCDISKIEKLNLVHEYEDDSWGGWEYLCIEDKDGETVVNLLETDYECELFNQSDLNFEYLKKYLSKEKIAFWDTYSLPFYALHISNIEVLTGVGFSMAQNALANGSPKQIKLSSVTYEGEKCILIPVKSKDLIKIIGGRKTIIIKKRIGKEMEKIINE